MLHSNLLDIIHSQVPPECLYPQFCIIGARHLMRRMKGQWQLPQSWTARLSSISRNPKSQTPVIRRCQGHRRRSRQCCMRMMPLFLSRRGRRPLSTSHGCRVAPVHRRPRADHGQGQRRHGARGRAPDPPVAVRATAVTAATAAAVLAGADPDAQRALAVLSA